MSLPESTSVGIIIGRFQVPKLHAGHRKLFDQVLSRHKRVLVLLGIPAWVGGLANPLDYKTREQMIRDYYPDMVVAPIKDRQTNEEWSKDVDKTIRTIYPVEQITLYGGRRGFTAQYYGGFQAIETLEDPAFDTETGTNIRLGISALPINSIDFRSGVIYASGNRSEPIVMCIDGAVLKKKDNRIEVLLIRKPQEIHWRFPGGRLDPTDKTLEAGANREVREETGVEVGKATYVASEGGLPDWRMTKAGIVVASVLYAFPYVYGAAIGGDDAAEARWFILDNLVWNDMEPCHQSFLAQLKLWAMNFDEVSFFGYTGENRDELSEKN